MKKCYEFCSESGVSCPLEECKFWIDYQEDLNCTIVAVEKNGAMTLREVSDRVDLSYVRVKQIQDRALEKIKKKISNKEIFKN
tara:strand:+ start:267 stop:515 length:249 start_codon:yes stop_codon:yes gene_type:complete